MIGERPKEDSETAVSKSPGPDRRAIAQYQLGLKLATLAALVLFWVPFVVAVLELPSLRGQTNALAGLMVGGPMVVMVVSLWLAFQFLRAIPGEQWRENWAILVFPWLTFFPFLNVLGPLGCLLVIRRYLLQHPPEDTEIKRR
jgi:hypothetical protein